MSYEKAAGRTCMMGLRPEAIMVDDAPSPDAFPIDVAAVTPLNEKTLLLLRAHDGHEFMASEAGTDEEPRRHGPAHARFGPERRAAVRRRKRRTHPAATVVRPTVTDVALSLQNVDKIYQRRGKPSVHAVKALQMDVNKGEIVALLGSSGCGKTSTLRMIAGFEDVTRGSIQLAGRRIDSCRPRDAAWPWPSKAIPSIRLSPSATISRSP